MRRVILLVLVATGVTAAAESADLSGLAGRYPILSDNGDLLRTGTARIVADSNRFGVVIEPLPLASSPVIARDYSSPATETGVETVDGGIEQRWEAGGRSLVIRYLTKEGSLGLEIQSCGEGGCAQEHLTLSRGGSPGEAVDVKAFLEARKGAYHILLAGGHKPKPTNETAEISSDNAEAVVTLPFCPPGETFCDPGFLFLTFEATRVFKRSSRSEVVYDLFLEEDGKTLYYAWSETSGGILVRNFQYDLKGERVCLEHQLERRR